MAFERPYPPQEERKKVTKYLRKWVDGFRKSCQKVPFLTSHKWRKLLFPRTSVAKVYRGATTTFKKKEIPLVTLESEEPMDYTSESEASSFRDWEDTEPVDIGDQGTVCSDISPPGRLSQADFDLQSELDNMSKDPIPTEEEQIAQAMALHDIMKETDEGIALEDAAAIGRAAAGAVVQNNARAQQGQGTSAMSDSSANQSVQSSVRSHPPGLTENPPPGLYGVVPPDQQRPHQSTGVQMGD